MVCGGGSSDLVIIGVTPGDMLILGMLQYDATCHGTTRDDSNTFLGQRLHQTPIVLVAAVFPIGDYSLANDGHNWTSAVPDSLVVGLEPIQEIAERSPRNPH